MSDNEDYWDTLMKKFNSMSDEEFEIYVKNVNQIHRLNL